MKPSRPGAFLVWPLLAVVLTAATVWMLVWPPEGAASTLGAAAFGFFAVVMIYVTLTEIMRRRMVVEMRAAPPRSPAASPPAPITRRPVAPMASVLTTPGDVLTSRDVSPVAARARAFFDRSVTLHRRPVAFLVVFTLVMLAFAAQPSPLNGTLLFAMSTAPLAVWLIETMSRWTPRNTLVTVFWLIVHAAWLAVTAYAGVRLAIGAFMGRGAPGVWRDAIIGVLCVVVAGWAWRRWSAAQRRHAREVAAAPSKRLLFLWVFGDGSRMNSLLLGIAATWRYLGPLQFLQGGEMIGQGNDPIRYLRGNKILAATDADVDARLASFKMQADPWWGAYATNSMLCGDGSWRHALERLLETDAVLMDLSGFSAENAGCVHEISRVFDRIPLADAVFLVDGRTDMAALRATMEEAWSRLDAASPNAAGVLVRLFRCDEEVRSTTSGVDPRVVQRNADALLLLLTADL